MIKEDDVEEGDLLSPLRKNPRGTLVKSSTPRNPIIQIEKSATSLDSRQIDKDAYPSLHHRAGTERRDSSQQKNLSSHHSSSHSNKNLSSVSSNISDISRSSSGRISAGNNNNSGQRRSSLANTSLKEEESSAIATQIVRRLSVSNNGNGRRRSSLAINREAESTITANGNNGIGQRRSSLAISNLVEDETPKLKAQNVRRFVSNNNGNGQRRSSYASNNFNEEETSNIGNQNGRRLVVTGNLRGRRRSSINFQSLSQLLPTHTVHDELSIESEAYNRTSQSQKPATVIDLIGHQTVPSLSSADKNIYLEVFNMIDTNADDSISAVELTQAMKDLDMSPTKVEVKEMMDYLDADQNDQVNFEEFMKLSYKVKEYRKPNLLETSDDLIEVFGLLDIFNTGFIDHRNIFELFESQGKAISVEHAKEILQMSSNCGDDGQLSILDFITLMQEGL